MEWSQCGVQDGGALYYRVNDKLMALPMRDGVPGSSRVAFDGQSDAGTFDAAGYDVMAGDRLLIINSAPPAGSSFNFASSSIGRAGAPVR